MAKEFESSNTNGNGVQIPPSSLIAMRHIWRTYQMGSEELHALRDVSFDVQKGEYVAIIGPSGSGKSTLMNLIGCLDTPTKGQYWINGHLVSEMSDDELARIRNKEIGFVFQTFNLLARATALHNVELPLIYAGISASERHERAQNALSAVELGDRVGHRPNELSGGQRQRVAIARALAVEPKVILADEPISMLDVSIRIGILNLMAELRDQENIAFLYVTHDLASARYFSDETMVMYAGHVVESGESEELIRNPQHPYTRLLLSAVPDPARGLKTEEIEVKGEIPMLGAAGQGCPFAARCQFVMDQCRQAMPPVTHLSDSRWVRCYLYGEDSKAPALDTIAAN